MSLLTKICLVLAIVFALLSIYYSIQTARIIKDIERNLKR